MADDFYFKCTNTPWVSSLHFIQKSIIPAIAYSPGGQTRYKVFVDNQSFLILTIGRAIGTQSEININDRTLHYSIDLLPFVETLGNDKKWLLGVRLDLDETDKAAIEAEERAEVEAEEHARAENAAATQALEDAEVARRYEASRRYVDDLRQRAGKAPRN